MPDLQMCEEPLNEAQLVSWAFGFAGQK